MGHQQPDDQWEPGAGGKAGAGGSDSSVLQPARLQGPPGDTGGAGRHQQHAQDGRHAGRGTGQHDRGVRRYVMQALSSSIM